MWELFSYGDLPYMGMSNMEAVEKVSQGYRLAQPAACPAPIYAMMQRCWQEDPERRPSFKELFDELAAQVPFNEERESGTR